MMPGMAEILSESLPVAVGSNGAKYPWAEWLDGQPRRLVRGEDFTIIPLHMMQSAMAAARRRGIKVTVRLEGENVVLQAVLPC